MLDFHLAELYGVETKTLKRAVKRNMERFPNDFCFVVHPEEIENLRYHFGASSWGGRRYLPYAFTEQGVAMLSSVLRSKRAVQVNEETTYGKINHAQKTQFSTCITFASAR